MVNVLKITKTAEKIASQFRECGKTDIFHVKPAEHNICGIECIPKLNTDIVEIKTVAKNQSVAGNATVRQKFNKFLNSMLNGELFDPPNKIQSLQSDFENLKAAREYAKGRSVAALNSKEPYEHMIVIDKILHKIFGEYKGNKHNASAMWDTLKFPKSCSVIHGHPASCNHAGKSISTPISFPDFLYMCKHSDDIIAFNPAGEFSLIMKTPKFKPLNEGQKLIYQMEHIGYIYPEILSELVNRLPKEFHGIASFKQLAAKINELKELGRFNVELQTKCKQIVHQYKKELQKLYSTDEFNVSFEQIKNIHKFWQDYADELGIIYKTNYSYLV